MYHQCHIGQDVGICVVPVIDLRRWAPGTSSAGTGHPEFGRAAIGGHLHRHRHRHTPTPPCRRPLSRFCLQISHGQLHPLSAIDYTSRISNLVFQNLNLYLLSPSCLSPQPQQPASTTPPPMTPTDLPTPRLRSRPCSRTCASPTSHMHVLWR